MSLREQFEARFPVPAGVQWSEEHQNYGWIKKSAFQRVITYRALWTGWQESRAAIEVEMPDDGADDARDAGLSAETFDHGYCFALDRMVTILESLGLKVKP